MSLTSRQRDKGANQAQALMPEARVLAYAVGRAGANPVLVVGALLGIVVLASIGIFAINWVAVFPGLLIIGLVQHLVSPPRAIAVCDQGIVVTDRSLLRGTPTKVLTVASFTEVTYGEEQFGRANVTTSIGPLWTTKGENAIVRQATSVAMIGDGAAPVPENRPTLSVQI